MLDMRTLLRGAGAAAGALMIAFAASSSADDILDDWDTVKPPPRPELKAVTLEGSTTALLILDMTKTGSCSARPRCVATIPNVKRLHDAARAAGAMLWYSLGANSDPCGHDRSGNLPARWRNGRPGRTGQISWLESGGEAESARHQDGHRVRHFVSRCRHWHRLGCGTARLQGDRADRLPVVRGSVHGAILGLAFLQGRTGRRHQQFDADAQYDGEVR